MILLGLALEATVNNGAIFSWDYPRNRGHASLDLRGWVMARPASWIISLGHQYRVQCAMGGSIGWFFSCRSQLSCCGHIPKLKKCFRITIKPSESALTFLEILTKIWKKVFEVSTKKNTCNLFLILFLKMKEKSYEPYNEETLVSLLSAMFG